MTTTMEHALTLEMTHRFAAPPERVYDAWLSEQWGAWLGPHGSRCQKASVDPRIGGAFRINLITPESNAVEIAGVYKELTRPRRIAFTWTSDFCRTDSLVTLTFEPDGAGTLMKLRQVGFDSPESRDGHNKGWTGTFERLEAFLAVVPPAR